jgi:hypothetical protein
MGTFNFTDNSEEFEKGIDIILKFSRRSVRESTMKSPLLRKRKKLKPLVNAIMELKK